MCPKEQRKKRKSGVTLPGFLICEACCLSGVSSGVGGLGTALSRRKEVVKGRSVGFIGYGHKGQGKLKCVLCCRAEDQGAKWIEGPVRKGKVSEY